MRKTLVLAATILTVGVSAQKSNKEVKGDKYYDVYAFHSAIKKYQSVKELSLEGKRKYAESFHNIGDNKQSADAYATLASSGEMSAEDMYKYASVLRLNGNYDESNVWMKKFQAKAPSDLRARSYVSNVSELTNMLKDQGKYKITHLDINTESQDFGPSFYGQQIVFNSTRQGATSIKRKYNWNELPFLDLYVADIDAETDQLTGPKQLNKQFNNKLHDGQASFYNGTNGMVFTRNNYEGESSDGVVKLQLFFSHKDENENWSEPKPFKLNSNEYSVGHPTISEDGNTMYFSSDMPGGLGGVDLYRIEKTADGKWGDAVNLGENVNTEGNEMFPFYQQDQGILFFASNGHLGLGGLDIFIAPDFGKGEFMNVLNAGTPVNTRADDFGLIVDEKMRKGYFSSNREEGQGDDDIYAFELLKPITFKKIIAGTVKDDSGNILADAVISLKDKNGKLVQTITTTKEGTYLFSVDDQTDYILNGQKTTYLADEVRPNTKSQEKKVIADLTLIKDGPVSLFAKITDKQTGNPIEGVKITILDKATDKESNLNSDAKGEILLALDNKKIKDEGKYHIILEKEGYPTKIVDYDYKFNRAGRYDVSQALDMTMDKGSATTEAGTEMVVINPIHFDLDAYELRPDAKQELDKIITLMNKYPNMVIELGSFTDCRATEAYNMTLSKKRAKASANYIKKNIKKPSRIYGKGYGESKLIKTGCSCENEPEDGGCPEDVHEINRRTEFKIIKKGTDNLDINNTSPKSF